MRPAAQENLDARIGADLQKGQAASPAARIQELTRLREAHMAAAEEIRLEEVRTAERERQRLEALPSSDETMLALGGKTEAEIVQELQQMRRSVAKGPYLPTLPEGTPVMAAAPKSALKMPALPQPSVSEQIYLSLTLNSPEVWC